MNEKTMRVLEMDKIKTMLIENTVSRGGAALAQKLEPFTEKFQVQSALSETDQAGEILRKRGSSPVTGFADVRGIIARLKIGAVLSMSELLSMAVFLRAVRNARKGILDNSDEGNVYSLAQQLVSFKDVEEEIYADIISEDSMADSASANLSSIRKKIRALNDGIKEKLNSMVRNLNKDGVLQDGIITMRSGRYVLPVLAANKGRVPGIVHDQSSSGATLFIEPAAVVEMNNSIKKLMLDERDEIQRILEDFSLRLGECVETHESNLELISSLDLIFAKAKLSREYNGISPKINDAGYVYIKNGRHPLLEKHTAVPITLWLGKEFSQLLITGPNTGGKTVTLKTVGLFALMTQCGLHIPAYEETQMPVFDNIFADIGDEQSIQQNLSTFSSHMKNIAQIMGSVTQNSLVLLDELGAGTDPAEGAALAMSILEELRVRRIRTVVTSHYAELKSYALSHAGVENASVEFDVDSLCPTYRLMVGVPGNSNAFLISSKLGLEKRLIDRARSYVDEDARRLDKVLSRAERYRIKAEEESNRAKMLSAETQQLKKEAESEHKKLAQMREKELARARRDAEQIKAKAAEEAAKIIEEIRALDKNDPSSIFKARAEKKRLEAKISQEKENPENNAPITEFKTGMDVYVISLEKNGQLISKPNSKNKAIVKIGAMETEIDASLLTYAHKEKGEKEKSGYKINRTNTAVPTLLDVRGQYADEAVLNTDMYIDLAYGRNLETVTIIHGKGTGALKSAIWSYLRGNKKVESFRNGAYGEGDAGVTVIKLKKQ